VIPGLRVIADYVTPTEEAALITLFEDRGTPRALASHGPGPGYSVGNEVPHQPPALIAALCDRLVVDGIVQHRPDSIGVGEYLPGDVLPPHIDQLHGGEEITILGLAGHVDMVFSRGPMTVVVPFQRRALLQMRDDCRYLWQHSVPMVTERRFGVVFRHYIDGGRR